LRIVLARIVFQTIRLRARAGLLQARRRCYTAKDSMAGARRTKIVATLGPGSEAPDILRGLLDAGTDVVRLNFSHGTAGEHRRRLEAARRAAADLGRPLAVLQDLPGPKLRIGALPGGGVTVAAGEEVVLTAEAPGDDAAIPVAYPHLADDVSAGLRIYLQDGEIVLTVTAVEGRRVRCRVESGGRVRQHAGLNLPGVRLSVPAVTDEDLRCLEWGLAHGVDFVGLSFVERPEEIERVRGLVAAHGARTRSWSPAATWPWRRRSRRSRSSRSRSSRCATGSAGR
jgi:pyruvate kinase